MNRALLIVVTAGLALSSGCTMANRDQQGDRVDATSGETRTFVYFIHPTREGFIESPTEEESALVGEHFSRLQELTRQGVVLLAGPSTDPPYTGIVIFRAPDRAQAQEIMEGDPAVKGGVFNARLSAFHLSLAGELNSD